MSTDSLIEKRNSARSDSGESTDSDSGNGNGEEGGKNALEWSVVVLGAAIVLFVFGYLTVKIFSGADAPPDLRVTLGPPETRGALVLVPVEVRNEGGLVAQEATLEVCAGAECAQLDFPFVPHGSVRSGQVGFSAPLAGPLRSRVVSYRE